MASIATSLVFGPNSLWHWSFRLPFWMNDINSIGVKRKLLWFHNRAQNVLPILLSFELLLYPCTMKLLGEKLVSLRPSVRPSVRPSRIPCPLCSAYSSRLDPIHIYTSYQATSEGVSCVKFFAKFTNLNFWQFFQICVFGFVLFSLVIWCESLVWVIMGRREVSQNAGVLVFLYCFVL